MSATASHREETMKAFVQDRYGPPEVLRLREIEKPVLADDRVLVKVRAASVNAFDWHMMTADFFVVRLSEGLRRPKTPIRGADVAGTVEAVGKNVTRFKPGDEVFGQGRGSFAEYTTTSETGVAPKPRNVSFEQAAAVPGAGYTALQGLRNKAQLKPGQRVLIYGAGGGVGTLAVQVAKALGAHVTAVSSPENLEMLRSIGVDEVIDYTREDFVERGERYDVFFDIGANRSLSACRRVLTKDGTFVLVGASRHPIARVIKTILLSKFVSQRLLGFLAKPTPEDLVILKEFLESGKLTPALDGKYSFDQVPDALRRLGTGKARGKIVISVP